MAIKETQTTIKTKARIKAFEQLKAKFPDSIQIGDSEIAIQVDEIEGVPIYATLSPTIKDYADRKTPKKTIKAFDPIALHNEYVAHISDREIKSAETAKRKAEKIERDRILREKARAIREEKARAKGK